MTGLLPGPHCLKARSIVLSCFLRVDTKRPRNRLRNAFMIGSSAKTAARLSPYAIPAGDSGTAAGAPPKAVGCRTSAAWPSGPRRASPRSTTRTASFRAARGRPRSDRSRAQGVVRRALLDVLPPAVLVPPWRRLVAERICDHQVGHLLEHPAEVVFLDGEVVEVRRRIQEVDRVEHAVLDRELDGVHVVAERLHERARVAYRVLVQRALDRLRDDIALLEW